MPRRAVLLLNLGSPDSTSVPDVKRYLREFLGDERVIDKPDSRFFRAALVKGIIIPSRAKNSAHAYSTIWTAEGSPLIVTSRVVQQKLAAALAASPRAGSAPAPVELAMNYGNPSIPDALRRLVAAGVTELLLFPQYPHYAMSSWETVVVKVRRVAAQLAPQMKIACEQPFYADPDYIEALVASARPYLDRPHDHLLFSYHSIPQRHLTKADSSRAHCLIAPDCCTTCSPAHATCYKAQVTRTTHLFAARAGLAPDRWSIAFQSRIRGEPWLTPYTDTALEQLPKLGKKRLLVITPAFVTDCLETLEEIRVRGAEDFEAAGGESFTAIPCLNDHPAFIEFLAKRVALWLTRADA